MAGIGFFAPLPLAMMMPFMAGQSMMMGDAFGKSYQFGKRKISAMSNEDFNKLTVADLANDIQADFNNIIPPLSQAVRQSSEFQSLIIQEMGKIIKSLPAEITQFFTGEEATNTNLTGMLTVILSKMLGLPAGSISPGGTAGFIGAPQTNPFFPGNILNPNEPVVPPGPVNTPFEETGEQFGPPAPPLTQIQLLKKYANFDTYRQKGGLLIQSQWNDARRALTADPFKELRTPNEQIQKELEKLPTRPAQPARPLTQSQQLEIAKLAKQILILVNNNKALDKTYKAIAIRNPKDVRLATMLRTFMNTNKAIKVLQAKQIAIYARSGIAVPTQ